VRRLQVDALTPDLAIELLGTRRPGDPRLGADPAAAAELARLCGHVPLVLQIIAVLMADDPARPVAELITGWPVRPPDRRRPMLRPPWPISPSSRSVRP